MHDSSIISLNAGASLGSMLELDNFVRGLLDTIHSSWSMCYISELHGLDHVQSSVFLCAGSRIYVHHPGAGSRCMAWIIRHSTIPHVASVTWVGRAGRVRLKTML